MDQEPLGPAALFLTQSQHLSTYTHLKKHRLPDLPSMPVPLLQSEQLSPHLCLLPTSQPIKHAPLALPLFLLQPWTSVSQAQKKQHSPNCVSYCCFNLEICRASCRKRGQEQHQSPLFFFFPLSFFPAWYSTKRGRGRWKGAHRCCFKIGTSKDEAKLFWNAWHFLSHPTSDRLSCRGWDEEETTVWFRPYPKSGQLIRAGFSQSRAGALLHAKILGG